MIKRAKEFVIATVTLTVLGVGCLAESKQRMGLAATSPSELGIAQRQEQCERGKSVAPAQETRKIREDKFQFSFNVPTNYRTEKRQYDNKLSISLYNPADDKFLDCCKTQRPASCGHGTVPVLVTVEPATPATRLIPELNGTTLRVENIRETTIANQKAIVYTTKSSMTGKIEDVETYLTASFFTVDKRNKVTISTFNYSDKINPVDNQVFNTVIASFAFVR